MSRAIAPARLLPIVTAPVDVPPLIDVAKFDESLSDIAAPLTVAPAAPVNNELNVLAPAKVWVVVLTKPTFVASAVCKYTLVPDITAPLALLVWLSIAPTMVTPVSRPALRQAVPSHIYVADVPGTKVAVPIIKLLVALMFVIYMMRPAVVVVGLGIV